MKNTKVRVVADAAMGAALCTLLYVISIYVPFISPFASFVCSAPLMYLACKRGSFAAISAFAVSTAALFIITGNILSAVLYATAYALPGMVFGICAAHNRKFYVTVAATAAAVLVGTMLELIIINGGGDGLKSMMEQITSAMGETMNNVLSAGELPEGIDAQRLVSQMLTSAVDTFMLLLPAIIIISSVIFAYAISMFGVFFLNRLRVKKISYVKFSMMKAPRSLCFTTAVLFLLCRLWGDGGVMLAASQNLLIVLEGAIAVCGFSFIDWAFARKISSGYIRALIYCAIFFMGFIFVPLIINILIFIGYIDGFGHFRVSGKNGDDDLED